MPRDDIRVRAILWTGVAFVGTVAVCVAAVLLLLHLWDMPPGGERVPSPHAPKFEGARLQSAPQQDLPAYRAEKQRLLSSSGWVDPAQGIVRIPVDVAMDMLAQGAAPAASQPQEAR